MSHMSWPTTTNPRTNFVTLRLTDEEAADVDWLRGVTNGKDRSATVRGAVMRVVAAERKRAKKAGHRGGDAAPKDVMDSDD